MEFILDSPEKWHVWIKIIQAHAEGNSIWEYINPDVPKAPTGALTAAARTPDGETTVSTVTATLPKLEPPTYPRYSDVKEGATSMSDLTEDDRETFEELRWTYQFEKDRYYSQLGAMAKIQSYILERVAEKYIPFALSCKDAHEMLQSLQKRLKPTDEARKRDLRTKYDQLKKVPRSGIDEWLDKWQVINWQAEKLGMRDITASSVHDFLEAIPTEGYRVAQIVEYETEKEDGKPLPTLDELVQRYRNYRANWLIPRYS